MNQIKITEISKIVAAFGLLVVMVLYLNKYFDSKNMENRIRIFEVCGRIAERTFEENGKKSVEVEKNFFSDCLKDLDYE